MTKSDVPKNRQLMILRIGHRVQRDMRVTTHVCLTARALGADGVIISDVHDGRLVDTITRVTRQFGGSFRIETGKPWRQSITGWKREGGKVVHLTAYGLPLGEMIDRIRSSDEKVLVIVGAEKVPGELFRMADWNVAVTSQPISEVSALGIFLDWFFHHRGLERQFSNPKLRIIPTAHGKKVVES